MDESHWRLIFDNESHFESLPNVLNHPKKPSITHDNPRYLLIWYLNNQ